MSRLGRASLLAAVILLALAAAALGADPTVDPSAPAVLPAEATAAPAESPAAAIEVLEGGDLRSEGEGPGLVGNPVLILLAVVVLGLVTVGTTVLLVRLGQRD